MQRSSEAAIWERIIHRERPMSRDTAREVLKLEIADVDKARMKELAERNRAGALAAGEDEELDDFCRVGTLLSLLKSRARQVIKPGRRVS